MKILKLAIISFIIFFLLLFLMSLLIPSTVRVSRAININAPRASILPYVNDTAQWRHWNELRSDQIYVEMKASDSNFSTTTWSHKGRDIQSTFRLEESAGITVVQWYFEFSLNWYPWEKFGSITFDKQFGMPMEKSLDNLEKLIDNSP